MPRPITDLQHVIDKIEEETKAQQALSKAKVHDVGKVPLRIGDKNKTTYLVKKKDYAKKKIKYTSYPRTHIV